MLIGISCIYPSFPPWSFPRFHMVCGPWTHQAHRAGSSVKGMVHAQYHGALFSHGPFSSPTVLPSSPSMSFSLLVTSRRVIPSHVSNPELCFRLRSCFARGLACVTARENSAPCTVPLGILVTVISLQLELKRRWTEQWFLWQGAC